MRVALAFCLVVISFQSASGTDKVKIEIVETRLKTQTVDVTVPGSPARSEAQCRAVANSIDCKSTTTDSTPPTPGQQLILQFFADAVFPDGSHIALLCLPVIHKGCAAIAPIAPEKSTFSCETTQNITTCTTKNLGVYEATRDKNDVVIYGLKGKLKYHVSGSW